MDYGYTVRRGILQLVVVDPLAEVIIAFQQLTRLLLYTYSFIGMVVNDIVMEVMRGLDLTTDLFVTVHEEMLNPFGDRPFGITILA